MQISGWLPFWGPGAQAGQPGLWVEESDQSHCHRGVALWPQMDRGALWVPFGKFHSESSSGENAPEQPTHHLCSLLTNAFSHLSPLLFPITYLLILSPHPQLNGMEESQEHSLYGDMSKCLEEGKGDPHRDMFYFSHIKSF